MGGVWYNSLFMGHRYDLLMSDECTASLWETHVGLVQPSIPFLPDYTPEQHRDSNILRSSSVFYAG
jgi:hypothetical protein